MTSTDFRVALVQIDANGTAIRTHDLPEGNTRFGRGPTFGISDQRVSRSHCSIVVDGATRSITILPNSPNVSYLIRHGDDDVPSAGGAAFGGSTRASAARTIALLPNNAVTARHGDVLSLLEGMIRFRLDAASEIDMRDADATLDVDATLPADRLPLPPQQHNGAVAALPPTFAHRQHSEQPAASAYASSSNVVASHVGASDEDELLDLDEIEPVRAIGSGSCGEVMLARWRGSNVACKKIFRVCLFF